MLIFTLSWIYNVSTQHPFNFDARLKCLLAQIVDSFCIIFITTRLSWFYEAFKKTVQLYNDSKLLIGPSCHAVFWFIFLYFNARKKYKFLLPKKSGIHTDLWELLHHFMVTHRLKSYFSQSTCWKCPWTGLLSPTARLDSSSVPEYVYGMAEETHWPRQQN